MSDFRDRFGELLSAAAAGLAAAPAAADPAGGDFRDRFAVVLTDAAVTLAVAGRATRPARRVSRRPHAWVGPLLRRPVLAAVAFAALAGTATGASIWLPTLGDQRFGENPGVSASSPPQAELDALAVLSRAQTDADRGAMTQAVLADVNSATKGVRTDYVRLLAGSGDSAFVLVPVVERDALSGDGGPPPAPPLRDALCVYAAVQPTTAVQCWSLAEVLSGSAYAQVGDELFGLAPDGDTTVHVTVGGQTLTAAVASNFFAVPLPSTGGLPSRPVVSLAGS